MEVSRRDSVQGTVLFAGAWTTRVERYPVPWVPPRRLTVDR